MSTPEAWLRGPIDGVPAELQPVAHALIQARDEMEAAISGLEPALLWSRVAGAASPGFHVLHACGSLDRLLTYARGDRLDATQVAALAAETTEVVMSSADLLERLHSGIERAVETLRQTPPASLDEPRTVGRSGLPSSVRGLLYHAGEHTARHAGQAVTTARIASALEGAG